MSLNEDLFSFFFIASTKHQTPANQAILPDTKKLTGPASNTRATLLPNQ